jgi:hypothetical protein
MKVLFALLVIPFVVGCSVISSNDKFPNKGVVAIPNGKDEMDSLKYSCDSCYEILKSQSVLDTVINIASSEAKEILRNKLSFRPHSVDIKVWRRDSLFYTNGKRIDSLVVVLAQYNCIGKNAYGVEDEVESTSLIYLINNKVVNLTGKIRKDSLSIISGVVSRILALNDDDGSIKIQPTLSHGRVHLIVTTDESCVEDARLDIGLADGTSVSSTSWNKFNCKGTSYFELTQAEVESLGKTPIASVSFSEDNHLYCTVPENEKDYFIQYMRLSK